MRSQAFTLCFTAIALVLLGPAARAEVDEVRFAEPETALEGRLQRDYTMRGGELLKATLLLMEDGIKIAGNKQASRRRDRRGVRNVQRVLIDPSYPIADEDLGSVVRVLGTLSNERNSNHRADAVMVVTDLKVLVPFDGDDGPPVGTFSTRPGGR